MKNYQLLIAVMALLAFDMAAAGPLVVEDNDAGILISNLGADGTIPVSLHEVGSDLKTSALPYADIIRDAAHASSLDEALLHAVIDIESGYNARATSSQGALGLMQLMPETARELGVTDPYDPTQNIHAGARYLSQLKSQFKDDLNLALASYNAGPGAVKRYGGKIPPYAETRQYIPRVLKIYRRLSGKSV